MVSLIVTGIIAGLGAAAEAIADTAISVGAAIGIGGAVADGAAAGAGAAGAAATITETVTGTALIGDAIANGAVIGALEGGASILTVGSAAVETSVGTTVITANMAAVFESAVPDLTVAFSAMMDLSTEEFAGILMEETVTDMVANSTAVEGLFVSYMSPAEYAELMSVTETLNLSESYGTFIGETVETSLSEAIESTVSELAVINTEYANLIPELEVAAIGGDPLVVGSSPLAESTISSLGATVETELTSGVISAVGEELPMTVFEELSQLAETGGFKVTFSELAVETVEASKLTAWDLSMSQLGLEDVAFSLTDVAREGLSAQTGMIINAVQGKVFISATTALTGVGVTAAVSTAFVKVKVATNLQPVLWQTVNLELTTAVDSFTIGLTTKKTVHTATASMMILKKALKQVVPRSAVMARQTASLQTNHSESIDSLLRGLATNTDTTLGSGGSILDSDYPTTGPTAEEISQLPYQPSKSLLQNWKRIPKQYRARYDQYYRARNANMRNYMSSIDLIAKRIKMGGVAAGTVGLGMAAQQAITDIQERAEGDKYFLNFSRIAMILFKKYWKQPRKLKTMLSFQAYTMWLQGDAQFKHEGVPKELYEWSKHFALNGYLETAMYEKIQRYILKGWQSHIVFDGFVKRIMPTLKKYFYPEWDGLWWYSYKQPQLPESREMDTFLEFSEHITGMSPWVVGHVDEYEKLKVALFVLSVLTPEQQANIRRLSPGMFTPGFYYDMQKHVTFDLKPLFKDAYGMFHAVPLSVLDTYWLDSELIKTKEQFHGEFKYVQEHFDDSKERSRRILEIKDWIDRQLSVLHMWMGKGDYKTSVTDMTEAYIKWRLGRGYHDTVTNKWRMILKHMKGYTEEEYRAIVKNAYETQLAKLMQEADGELPNYFSDLFTRPALDLDSVKDGFSWAMLHDYTEQERKTMWDKLQIGQSTVVKYDDYKKAKDFVETRKVRDLNRAMGDQPVKDDPTATADPGQKKTPDQYTLEEAQAALKELEGKLDEANERAQRALLRAEKCERIKIVPGGTDTGKDPGTDQGGKDAGKDPGKKPEKDTSTSDPTKIKKPISHGEVPKDERFKKDVDTPLTKEEQKIQDLYDHFVTNKDPIDLEQLKALSLNPDYKQAWHHVIQILGNNLTSKQKAALKELGIAIKEEDPKSDVLKEVLDKLGDTKVLVPKLNTTDKQLMFKRDWFLVDNPPELSYAYLFNPDYKKVIDDTAFDLGIQGLSYHKQCALYETFHVIKQWAPGTFDWDTYGKVRWQRLRKHKDPLYLDKAYSNADQLIQNIIWAGGSPLQQLENNINLGPEGVPKVIQVNHEVGVLTPTERMIKYDTLVDDHYNPDNTDTGDQLKRGNILNRGYRDILLTLVPALLQLDHADDPSKVDPIHQTYGDGGDPLLACLLFAAGFINMPWQEFHFVIHRYCGSQSNRDRIIKVRAEYRTDPDDKANDVAFLSVICDMRKNEILEILEKARSVRNENWAKSRQDIVNYDHLPIGNHWLADDKELSKGWIELQHQIQKDPNTYFPDAPQGWQHDVHKLPWQLKTQPPMDAVDGNGISIQAHVNPLKHKRIFPPNPALQTEWELTYHKKVYVTPVVEGNFKEFVKTDGKAIKIVNDISPKQISNLVINEPKTTKAVTISFPATSKSRKKRKIVEQQPLSKSLVKSVSEKTPFCLYRDQYDVLTLDVHFSKHFMTSGVFYYNSVTHTLTHVHNRPIHI